MMKATVQERRVRVVVVEIPIEEAEEMVKSTSPAPLLKIANAIEGALADEQADRAKEREEGEDVPF